MVAAKQIVNKIAYQVWEFDTHQEMVDAAKLECHICGDSINTAMENESEVIEIHNYHQGSVRWKGIVKQTNNK